MALDGFNWDAVSTRMYGPMPSRSGRIMVRLVMHERHDQWLCLACWEAPHWVRPPGRVFFDVYPQLRAHWREVHGVTDVADSWSR